MNLRHAFVGATLLAGVCAAALPAFAGGLWSTLPAPVIPMSGNEVLPCDTELANGANPQTEGCTVNNIAALANSGPSRGNAIIGGDFTTNLWQRSTSGTATTSGTPAYDSADRWAQWSTSAGAQVTVSRSSASTDIPPAYQYAMKVAHTNTTAGQVCVGQEIASINSYQFQGSTAELDFHAYTGAGFTGANANMTAYIVYGTGSDEGIAKMAYTVNPLSGTASGWAGGAQAAAAVVNLGAVSTAGRYGVVANIPATATEIGVALCWTATVADTNDYIAFDGVQLIRNNANAAIASATVGYSSNVAQLVGYDRRQASVEAQLQYSYYWRINEVDTANVIQGPGGYYDTTTTCSIAFSFPSPMRAAPTADVTGLSATTFKIAPTTTPVVLATPFGLLQVGSTSTTIGAMSFKTTAETQFVNCDLVSTAAGAGYFGFSAEL